MIGFFLEFLFKLDQSWLNLLWVVLMVFFAAFSVIRSSELKLKRFLLPALFSMLIPTLFVLLYFNFFVVKLNDLLEARFLIAVGGMLLGNSLRGNIIGISNFYHQVKRNEHRYFFRLSLGAEKWEALLPFFRTSMKEALKPLIASIANMGLVFIPGMMTGQILGGAGPLIAIKYQMAIMITIFVVTTLSITFTVLVTAWKSFDGYGILDKGIFHESSRG